MFADLEPILNRIAAAMSKKKNKHKKEKKEKKSRKLRIKFREGSVLTAPRKYAIAHCVSVCKKMSAGVAKTICERYPANRLFTAGSVGDVGVCTTEGRTIYNMQTKPTFRDKPTFPDFARTLRRLKEKMQRKGDLHLAIPHIGCGRDLLNWEHQVLPLIKKVFDGSGFTIRIYDFKEF